MGALDSPARADGSDDELCLESVDASGVIEFINQRLVDGEVERC